METKKLGMKRVKNESRSDRLSRLQGEVFSLWKQLEALGYLLDRQGDASEGTPELQGLGVALSELSGRLYSVWRNLDIAEFPQD